MASLNDLRYAFFGGSDGQSASDAEYEMLTALVEGGVTAADMLLIAGSGGPGGTAVSNVDDEVDLAAAFAETKRSHMMALIGEGVDDCEIILPSPETTGPFFVTVLADLGDPAPLLDANPFSFVCPGATFVSSVAPPDTSAVSVVYVLLPLFSEEFSAWFSHPLLQS